MPGLFIDIHTHRDQPLREDLLIIRNLAYQDETPPDGNRFYSVGLHPWDTSEAEYSPDRMSAWLSRPEVIAVGECGLDRLRGTSLDRQSELFLSQARLAGRFRKPVIIHCVKAWPEIIRLKKEHSSEAPWIIHGFRGKPELAVSLLDQGFLLSFGAAILKQEAGLADSLRLIPDDRLFLETDDSPLTIGKVYEQATRIKNLSLASIQDKIMENFINTFGTNGTSGVAAKD